MSGPKTLVEAAFDVLSEIKRVGIHEALGIEEVPPGRVTTYGAIAREAGRGCPRCVAESWRRTG